MHYKIRNKPSKEMELDSISVIARNILIDLIYLNPYRIFLLRKSKTRDFAMNITKQRLPQPV